MNELRNESSFLSMRLVSFTKNTTQSFVFHREFYEEKHQVKKKKMTIYSKVSREINL